ncbi:MAG: ATP-binding protein [Sphingomonas sp.]
MNAAVSPRLLPVDRFRSLSVTPAIEFLILAIAAAVATASYFVIANGAASQVLLRPPLVALLLVANLLPGVLLLVLIGRRIAMRRASRSPIGGRARLHVRLVALFSAIAAVPTLLVVIFASLLFQYGVEFWSSQRARGMLENATSLVRENYQRELTRVADETRAMSGDLANYLQTLPIESKKFQEGLVFQTYRRELSEAMIVKRGDSNPLVVLNPYGRPIDNIVTPRIMDQIDRGAGVVTVRNRDRVGAVVPIAYGSHSYLYAARVFDEQLALQLRRGEAVVSDYRALQIRSRTLQLRFNAALLVVSLLIVAIAVWIALEVADRLVRPVGALVAAAHRIAEGDLTVRVPEAATQDEIGTLAGAFNTMTGQLQAQTGALESRRALIEAVMSGVTAGVVSVDRGGAIRLMNRSAAALLDAGEENPAGRSLRDIAPELATLVEQDEREAIVEIGTGADAKTLAVKITRASEGPILTFDDITGQLLDQRRAAWSDVARRIAHEIKNPLTPIQLAAERLQRRYGKQIAEDDGTFSRLTETIVRQVGDLRRMVDEFSSFARMPKPVFRNESLVDIARQTLFLHEVAHPTFRFTLVNDLPDPALVCDRRQLGQAFTNIVKNAVEAIEARGEGPQGAITLALRNEDDDYVVVEVTDNGVGLPAARDRIVEPYVTTRTRGTGLGLAIVKKIVEEHMGDIAFSDAPDGGTRVTIRFDRAALAALGGDGGVAPPELQQTRI